VESRAASLRIAFYNVGMHTSQMQTRVFNQQQELLAKDVETLFVRHNLHMVLLCELGEHEEGLPDQEAYLQEVVRRMNNGAEEPAGGVAAGSGGAEELAVVPLGLLSGDMPAYAVFARQDIIDATGDVLVTDILYHVDLLHGTTKWKRQCLELELRWQGKVVRVLNIHSPSSNKRKLDSNARQAIFTRLMQIVGARVGGGAAEPAAWIIGGDMNANGIWMGNEGARYQPGRFDDSGENPQGRYIEQVYSNLTHHRHGDVAICQGLWAYQLDADVGASYGGLSHVHNAVNVVVTLPSSCAAEPAAMSAVSPSRIAGLRSRGAASSAGSGGAPELELPSLLGRASNKRKRMRGERQRGGKKAEEEAEEDDAEEGTAPNDNSRLVHADDQTGRDAGWGARDASELAEVIAEVAFPRRRRSMDGELYSYDDFLDHSPAWGHWMWEQARRESLNDATEEQWEQLADQLWPRRTSRRALFMDGVWLPGAVEVPAVESSESIFRIVRYYRRKFLSERAAASGAAEPAPRLGNAAEPTLTGAELGEAWALWRKDWEKFGLYPEQLAMRKEEPKRYKSQLRSWFQAHVKRVCGNTHVAKVLLAGGELNRDTVAKLMTALADRPSAPPSEDGGASEPAFCEKEKKAGEEQADLRHAALRVRQDFREARRLHTKVEADKKGLVYAHLKPRQRELVEKFMSRQLHVEVDAHNKAYGHGMARSNDYGFAVGDDMFAGVSSTRQLMSAVGM